MAHFMLLTFPFFSYFNQYPGLLSVSALDVLLYGRAAGDDILGSFQESQDKYVNGRSTAMSCNVDLRQV